MINKARSYKNLEQASKPNASIFTKISNPPNISTHKKSRSHADNFMMLSRRVSGSKERNVNFTMNDESVSNLNLPKTLKKSSNGSEKAPLSYPQPQRPPKPNHRRNLTSILSKTSNNITCMGSENGDYSRIEPSPSVKVLLIIYMF